MTIDIKSEEITPRRQTFSHIARRFGADKPASRYEEATYDVQPKVNFHYRPTYAPEFELFDSARTKIAMKDWYVFKDPRQFYYATYNINRAAMQQRFDSALEFVEKRALLNALKPRQRQKIAFYLIPLRHFEWAANMNFQLIADWAYGTQIASAAAFAGADRLGIAQLISRIALAMGEGGDELLVRGKTQWMTRPEWQPLRRLVEDVLIVRDWFKTFIAQYLMDGIVYPMVYESFDRQAPSALSLITGFMRDWFSDHSRWTDSVIKTAAMENADNRELLSKWCAHWLPRAAEAMHRLAKTVLGESGHAAATDVEAALRARLETLGVNVSGGQ
jgi:phenol hydroxylase P1 protein